MSLWTINTADSVE